MWCRVIGACFLLASVLGGPVAGATRLGLHVTQEELDIWRARLTDTVNRSNGFTYQSIYQNRILTEANTFRSQSHPGGDGWWAGYTGAGCAPDYVGGNRVAPYGSPYQRGHGMFLLRSAFVYLLTGDASYANPVRTELLSQIAQAGTNWANTSKWCPTPGNGPPPSGSWPTTWEISPWIVRLLTAYDYINAYEREGHAAIFSAGEKASIEQWFLGAAVIFHDYHMDGINIIGAYPGIYNEPPTFTCPAGNANCTNNERLLYWQGPIEKNATATTFFGQAVASPTLSMMVGLLTSNTTHITNAKKYITGFIRAGIFDNGAIADYTRWAEDVCFQTTQAVWPPDGHGCPGGMWGHLAEGGITASIDALARTGDTSLYTLSGPTLVPVGSGGTVSWQTVTEGLAKLVNRTTILYGASNSGDVIPETILTWDSDRGACCGRYEDMGMIGPANLFYQNSHMTTAMNRTAKAANSNTGAVGCNDSQFGGCFVGWLFSYPDIPFMYGNMQGIVNPYVLGPTSPPPISVDSTFSGYNFAAINDGVINATGGTATTWASQDTAAEHWIVLDFGTAETVGSVTIHWAYNAAQSAYMTSNQVLVQRWDGAAYQTLATMAYAGNVASSTVNFTPVSTSRLRFSQPANQGNPGYPGVIWLTEIDYSSVGLNTPPNVTITSPTSGPTYVTSTTPLTDLGGQATDNDGTISTVTWTCTPGCGSGNAALTLPAWSVPSIPLSAASSVIVVTATDNGGETSQATLTVSYDAPAAQNVTIFRLVQ